MRQDSSAILQLRGFKVTHGRSDTRGG